jgi:hypothetical protein
VLKSTRFDLGTGPKNAPKLDQKKLKKIGEDAKKEAESAKKAADAKAKASVSVSSKAAVLSGTSKPAASAGSTTGSLSKTSTPASTTSARGPVPLSGAAIASIARTEGATPALTTSKKVPEATPESAIKPENVVPLGTAPAKQGNEPGDGNPLIVEPSRVVPKPLQPGPELQAQTNDAIKRSQGLGVDSAHIPAEGSGASKESVLRDAESDALNTSFTAVSDSMAVGAANSAAVAAKIQGKDPDFWDKAAADIHEEDMREFRRQQVRTSKVMLRFIEQTHKDQQEGTNKASNILAEEKERILPHSDTHEGGETPLDKAA